MMAFLISMGGRSRSPGGSVSPSGWDILRSTLNQQSLERSKPPVRTHLLHMDDVILQPEQALKVSHKACRRFDHAAGWNKRHVRGGNACRRSLECYCCSKVESKLHARRQRCQLTGQRMDIESRRSSIQCIVARVSVAACAPCRKSKTASARHRELGLRLCCNRPQVGRCVTAFGCRLVFDARPRRCATS